MRPYLWVPSLYLAMGIPYNVINGTAVRMYKSLGYADSQITVAVGSIGIAWSLKPLWAAFLDMYRTKKFFVLSMEVLCGLLFAAVAMSLPRQRLFPDQHRAALGRGLCLVHAGHLRGRHLPDCAGQDRASRGWRGFKACAGSSAKWWRLAFLSR